MRNTKRLTTTISSGTNTRNLALCWTQQGRKVEPPMGISPLYALRRTELRERTRCWGRNEQALYKNRHTVSPQASFYQAYHYTCILNHRTWKNFQKVELGCALLVMSYRQSTIHSLVLQFTFDISESGICFMSESFS